MGLAHLNSFTKKRENKRLILIEKNYGQRKRIYKLLKKKKINFEILKTIPKNDSFDFGIIASKSIERISICKQLIKNNKIKILFLEKFLFNSLEEYKVFKNLQLKYKIQTYVNVWAEIFLKRIKLKKNKKKFSIDVLLPNKKLLTNLIHFFEIFKILSSKNFKIDFKQFDIKKIDNRYHDGNGIIKFKSQNGSKMVIRSKKMSNNIIIFYCCDKKKIKIVISNGKIFVTENSKKIIKKFPLASIETNLFFNTLMKKNKISQKTFPRYTTIEKSSKKIINSLNKEFKTKVRIS